MTQLFTSKAPETEGNNQETNEMEPESYLQELVGDGKKFKDAEALAKGKHYADAHNKRLEQELERVREELNQRMTIQDFMEEMKKSASKNNNDSERDEQLKNTNGQINPDQIKNDLLAQVNQLMEQQKKQTLAERNVEKVREVLQKTWGNNFSAKLTQRASELNLDQDFLSALAETNPQGFLNIVLPQKGNNMLEPPKSNSTGIRPEPHLGERNKAYYDKLRRENPKKYLSKEIQVQEHRDAVRLGSAFFN